MKCTHIPIYAPISIDFIHAQKSNRRASFQGVSLQKFDKLRKRSENEVSKKLLQVPGRYKYSGIRSGNFLPFSFCGTWFYISEKFLYSS